MKAMRHQISLVLVAILCIQPAAASPIVTLDKGRLSVEAPGYSAVPSSQKAMSYPFSRPTDMVLSDKGGCSFVAISAFPAILSSEKNLLESLRERVEGFCPSSAWVSEGFVKISGRTWAYAEVKTHSLSGGMHTALLTTLYRGAFLSVSMSASEDQFPKKTETFARVASSLRISE